MSCTCTWNDGDFNNDYFSKDFHHSELRDLIWFHVLLVPSVLEVEDVKEIWEAIKPEVQATIEEYLDLEEIIDEGDGAVEFQGDEESALEW